jgi:hypothetical protein
MSAPGAGSKPIEAKAHKALSPTTMSPFLKNGSASMKSRKS